MKLTKDPEGRATMGGSSGGSGAMIMAWYHPELYHRVLTYSGTYVNQQWPQNPEIPHGAWEFHERLIPKSPRKPLRIWMEVGDSDNPNIMRDEMHDWVLANENMAKALAAKGYHYQFVFAKNGGHTRQNRESCRLCPRRWNTSGRVIRSPALPRNNRSRAGDYGFCCVVANAGCVQAFAPPEGSTRARMYFSLPCGGKLPRDQRLREYFAALSYKVRCALLFPLLDGLDLDTVFGRVISTLRSFTPVVA